MYARAAETLPRDLAKLVLLDRKGRVDLIGHILLCAGWDRKHIAGDQVAPEWLWREDTGEPTKLASARLGYAKPGVLVVEELLRLSDLGTWHEKYHALVRLSKMLGDAEFRIRVYAD